MLCSWPLQLHKLRDTCSCDLPEGRTFHVWIIMARPLASNSLLEAARLYSNSRVTPKGACPHTSAPSHARTLLQACP
jgi:hypothetical protein